MKKITRRGFAILSSGALATSTAHAAELIPFKIGISAAVVSILPIYLAEAGGFYKKQGLDAEIISAEGGTRGIQVLLSGEMQVMHVGLAPVVQANAQNADLRMVAATTNTLPIVVFATKKTNPPIPKGSSVGISTFGSETDVAISIALKQLGMTRNDVTISQTGGTAQRYAAMLAGRIDIGPLLEPSATVAREKGFVPVVDLAAEHTPWIFDGVVVNHGYIDRNRDHLLRFLRAYIEGAMRGIADEAFAKETISRRLKVTDKAAIDASYVQFKTLMPLDAAPSLECAKYVLGELKTLGLPVASDNTADYVDLGLIDELRKDGFIDQIHKQYGIS